MDIDKTIDKQTRSESKVKVKFVTNDAKIRVTDKELAVPLRLGRLGLSEAINLLLQEESDKEITPKPFDFLINGKFIRTTLDKHIKNLQLTEETVITIEYLEAITEPKKEKECQHDDWISCSDGSSFGLICSGSYDLGVRVWKMDGQLMATGTGHLAGVKSVKWLNAMNSDRQGYLVSSGLDKSIRLWELNKEGGSLRELATLKEHSGTVESISVSPDSERLISAGMDNKLKMWNINEIREQCTSGNGSAEVKKKRKTASSTVGVSSEVKEVTQSLASMDAHNQGITVVDWSTQFQIFSGSMDHHLFLWDLTTMSKTLSINTPNPLHDISYSTESGLVATAHTDKTIRVYDPRVDDSSKYQIQSLISHSSWVTSVNWQPNSQYNLCSASHDGTVKYWDIRTKIPLYTIDNLKSGEKLLTSCWVSSSKTNTPLIASGGTDSKLRIHFDEKQQE
ncbi:WD40 repeat-containing protein [Tieghemostelium lacteum]|uniref:Ribosome biogenesis protein WDR12 homolog n=1 Tax=Tieghemostelium lacteum TaxID=361077 RepID=A0A152A6T7_TIELA|nr:WD40 repeat-containing protein [Tieghemostelium lacteum]|eukprot:KYR01949.1 WD40 repeat-containing protein [Tieghemostelium lacteum]